MNAQPSLRYVCYVYYICRFVSISCCCSPRAVHHNCANISCVALRPMQQLICCHFYGFPATNHSLTSLIPRPHPQRGKGSGDYWAISWLCWIKALCHLSCDFPFTTHASCPLWVLKYAIINRTWIWLAHANSSAWCHHDQVLSPKSPDPFPLWGWGLGTRLLPY